MNDKRRFLTTFLCVLFTHISFSQQTALFTDPEKEYKLALDLFQNEKYSAARELFENVEQSGKEVSDITRSNASYFKAVCAAELFHADAEELLAEFYQQHPENTYSSLAAFQLGRLHYKQKKYKTALAWFEKTDIYYLRNEEISEYYFKAGYCYFNKGELDKANKCFYEIIDIDSKYKTAANYYYAHVAYASENYNTALTTFNKISGSETFAPFIPYYISQIFFEQGKHKELVDYAIPQLSKEGVQHKTEMKRMIAESYYRTGNFKTAQQYFDDYEKNISGLSREERYQIGYSYYKQDEFGKARSYFEKVASGSDALTQNAYYHLADCFLKEGNKQSARNAFQFSAKHDFDKEIKEESAFQYAKLSYELQFQPVAINSFRDFLKNYPSSSHADEVNELLAGLYLTTKNYKDALTALDNIKNKSDKSKKAYQKVAYYRGLEYFNDGDKQKAISFLDKAIIYPADAKLQAMAMFWKAEALYHLNKYPDALKEYRIFLFHPPAVGTEVYHQAHYTIGYCHFKMEQYDEAQQWFRKYIRNKQETDKPRYDDALIRIGDAMFMTKNYADAATFYADAVKNGAKAGDYCLFQQGIVKGIQGDRTGKISSLQQLAAKYPKSNYVDDAEYETGIAYLAGDENDKAGQQFRSVLEKYPKSEYHKRAMLSLALVYYNDKNDEEALKYYKQVINKYPSTPESAEALTGVKNIYVSQGNPDQYFDFVKTIPNASVSSGAQDSLTYEAAEQVFMRGETQKASKDFSIYLEKYPNGVFSINATFYKAECELAAKNYEAALKNYEAVAALPRNTFTEKSLLRAGNLHFRNKNYSGSAEYYDKLEQSADFKDNLVAAQAGLMRSYFNLKEYERAITYCEKLLSSEKVPNEILNEAHLIYGRSALMKDDFLTAKKEFAAVEKTMSGEAGAESKYRLAYISFVQKNYSESKKKAFEVINQVPSYDFWIAKSFILLADNYLAEKDTFQARHTLQSIIDNYQPGENDTEDLKATAIAKLNSLGAEDEGARIAPKKEGEAEEEEEIEVNQQ